MSNKVPSIEELREDKTLDYPEKMDKFNMLINYDPPKEWLKPHPTVAKIKDLPIGRIEWLLTRVFKEWHIEVREAKLIANSVMVTVRIHVYHPLLKKWTWQDGVGACPIQTKQGKGAVDFDQIHANSVMKATPAAKSYAVKNAAKGFGKLFGRGISREDEIGYSNLISVRLDPDDMITLEMYQNLEGLLLTANIDESDKQQIEGQMHGMKAKTYEAALRFIADSNMNPLLSGDNSSQKQVNEQLDKHIP